MKDRLIIGCFCLWVAVLWACVLAPDAMTKVSYALRTKPSLAQFTLYQAFYNNGLGHAYLAKNELENAFLAFEEGNYWNKRGGRMWHSMAYTRQLQGRLEEAKRLYLKATGIGAYKKVYRAFSSLGNIYALQDSIPKAIFCWQTAMQIQPASYLAPCNYATWLLANGRENEAETVLRPFYEIGLPQPDVVLRMGSVFAAQGDEEGATQCFARAIKIDLEKTKRYFNYFHGGEI